MPALPRTLLLTALAAACACVRPPVPDGAVPEDSAAEGRARVTGLFHVIRGPEVHYFVTDSAGTTRELTIPAALLERAGGPLALDRRRVLLFVQAAPGARVLAVDSIVPLGPEP